MWKNGEISWVSLDALKDQNLWLFVAYAVRRRITKHPDFQWVQKYIKSAPIMANKTRAAQQPKSSSTPKFKFGVQVLRNAVYAMQLDQVNGDLLWKEATDSELISINKFKTFRVLKKGEAISAGYKCIPYHMIYDVKFDGRCKCWLVAGGHCTPDVPPEEVYSGVVSMDTICIVFVIAALNGLEVCAADISTAFLYSKT